MLFSCQACVSTAHRTRPLLDLAKKTRNLCQRRILKCESHWRPVVLCPVFPISSSAARAKTRAPRSDNMFTSCQKVKILLGQALYSGLQCFSHPLHLLPGAFWGQRWMWIPDQTGTRNKKASVRNCSFFSALCPYGYCDSRGYLRFYILTKETARWLLPVMWWTLKCVHVCTLLKVNCVLCVWGWWGGGGDYQWLRCCVVNKIRFAEWQFKMK